MRTGDNDVVARGGLVEEAADGVLAARQREVEGDLALDRVERQRPAGRDIDQPHAMPAEARADRLAVARAGGERGDGLGEPGSVAAPQLVERGVDLARQREWLAGARQGGRIEPVGGRQVVALAG